MRKTPVTLGVLSITFGALMAAMSSLGLLLGPMLHKLFAFSSTLPGQHTELMQAQVESTEAMMLAQSRYQHVTGGFYILLSIALIVIGIGLYRRRPWSRRAGIVWAAMALVMVVLQSVAYLGWVEPAMTAAQDAVFAAHGLQKPFALLHSAARGGVVVSMLLYAVYPALLIALLGRSSAANDFVSATPAS
jgi:hypothetical protein